MPDMTDSTQLCNLSDWKELNERISSAHTHLRWSYQATCYGKEGVSALLAIYTSHLIKLLNFSHHELHNYNMFKYYQAFLNVCSVNLFISKLHTIELGVYISVKLIKISIIYILVILCLQVLLLLLFFLAFISKKNINSHVYLVGIINICIYV